MDFTIVIPFWHGHATLGRLLGSLPDGLPVVIVNDFGSTPPDVVSPNVTIISLDKRGYFAGAVNAGLQAASSDVLVLNQDVAFTDNRWLEILAQERERYAIIGDGVYNHPAWLAGYVQGTFMFLRRDAVERVGMLNGRTYPLWGGTCEWQLRACRMGYAALPLREVPGMAHERRGAGQFGSAVAQAIAEEPGQKWKLLSTPPEVSVVVPCYNYGRYLPDAIASLLAQSFASWEAIIVDDASTDDSADACRSFANAWKGIRVICRQWNGGTAACLNTGVKAAYGRFITILSADDMYQPDRLARMVRLAWRNPNGVIYDDIVWRTPGGDVVKKMSEYFYDDLPGIKGSEPPGLLNRNTMHAGIMYPRRAWKETGGYPEAFADGREDWAFNVALGRAGYCGVHLHEPLYIYRREKQNRSLTNTSPQDHQRFRDKIRKTFPDVYREEKPMACCGGRGRRGKASQPTPPKPARITAPQIQGEQNGGILLEYIGKNVGTETWRGASGRIYKFGRNPRRWRGYVNQDDAGVLLASKQFKRINIAKPAARPELTVMPALAPAVATQTIVAAPIDDGVLTAYDVFVEPSPAEPMPAEVVAEPAPELDREGDLLLRIKGVGRQTAALLRENGYATVADVADADPRDLSDIGVKRADRVIDSAREMLAE